MKQVFQMGSHAVMQNGPSDGSEKKHPEDQLTRPGSSKTDSAAWADEGLGPDEFFASWALSENHCPILTNG